MLSVCPGVNTAHTSESRKGFLPGPDPTSTLILRLQAPALRERGILLSEAPVWELVLEAA